ncbi:hypothetical protein TREMEDRAFT_58750 [Tremella mesenterica DSM 1558]|uniref:uncharacterized protein n=1 Tax=Tremella mesenterica (strain ATCC 24925 / CBS 8224 / DSM 1558 / NBRC 9311 / NRRL Y-6157 / RJB 2259-6 / UBC 559-6) TaxID=578456 RepID=UPI0003F49BD1|nr:uncharacterized protein TREMEDRAFT_58750 [Tremella mesenterica DSM 1558]EIW72581.1 hypothetical protein TREMEDRAFT_58750 [Tremella mesenterica DSM 1558]
MSSEHPQLSVNETNNTKDTSGAELRAFLSEQIAPLSESEFKQLTEFYSSWKYNTIPTYEPGTEEDLAQRKEKWVGGTRWDGLDIGSLRLGESPELRLQSLMKIIEDGVSSVKEKSQRRPMTHQLPHNDEAVGGKETLNSQVNAGEIDGGGDYENDVDEDEEDDWSYSDSESEKEDLADYPYEHQEGSRDVSR